jgi:electron transport complex protein RnfG
MKNIVKNAGILLAITVVAAIALSFVYELTKEPIALAAQKAKASSRFCRFCLMRR